MQKYFVPISTHFENVLTTYGMVINNITEKGLNFRNELALLKQDNKAEPYDKGISFNSEKDMNDFVALTKFKIIKNILIATKAGTSCNWRHDLKFFRLPKNLNCTEEEYIEEMGLQDLKGEIEQLAKDAKAFKVEKINKI